MIELIFLVSASISDFGAAPPRRVATLEDKLTASTKKALNSVPTYKVLPGRSRCSGARGYVTPLGTPRTFIWRPEWLKLEKQHISNNPIYAKPLLDAANSALQRGPYSVVDKTTESPSGNPHDYYSIGPYWWPTEGTLNGRPYSRRDGIVNPESRSESFDKSRMMSFGADVRVLALAYHHFGDQRYANHAGNLLRAWFVSFDTKMNPNLNHGQAIPGVSLGRAEGIIELDIMSEVIESIGLIEPSMALSEVDRSMIRQWFADLIDWMATSQIGRSEHDKLNNHGLYYDYLITHFSLFAGREDLARQVVTEFLSRRISVQMRADGSLPEELARTRSWHYSFYALKAATKLATLGECVGLDLWSAKTDDGRGLAKGFAFMAPYHAAIRKWPYKDTGLIDPVKLQDLKRVAMEPLRMMAWGTGDVSYERLAANHDVIVRASLDYWLPSIDKSESVNR